MIEVFYKEDIRRILLLAGIGLVSILSVSVWQKIAVFINGGLESSKSIRILQGNFCATVQKDGPHFSGCNSIL